MAILKLTAEQTAQLTKLSDRSRVVSLKFGAGWIGFDDRDPNMQWALDALTSPKGVNNASTR